MADTLSNLENRLRHSEILSTLSTCMRTSVPPLLQGANSRGVPMPEVAAENPWSRYPIFPNFLVGRMRRSCSMRMQQFETTFSPAFFALRSGS